MPLCSVHTQASCTCRCQSAHHSCRELAHVTAAISRCLLCNQQIPTNRLSGEPPLQITEYITREVTRTLQREPAKYIEAKAQSHRSFPTRHVHFDLVKQDHKHQRFLSDHNDEAITFLPRRAHDHSSSTYLVAPVPPIPAPLVTPPNRPTIYIITYSTEVVRSSSALTALLHNHLPARHPPISHLYTIDASALTPPPAALCDAYSGLSPLIQAHVTKDVSARRVIDQAVRDLVDFAMRDGAGKGREVALSVGCTAGTHRSVGIGEVVGMRVREEVRRRGSVDGVKVVVRHVHRIRGRRERL